MPGGWFQCGGDRLALRGYSGRRIWQDDVVISRFQVTNREYMAFLNSLLEQGREDEAFKWVPRENAGENELGAMIYSRDDRFVLLSDSIGNVWHEDWPVCMVTWHCVDAYCKWKSQRIGLNYRLPTEFEWEKSARGVDGRWHVWGDGFDESYCLMIDSHPSHRLPAPVDSYPIDESVYGVRGLAGNKMDWISSAYRKGWDEDEDPELWINRGGSWNSNTRGNSSLIARVIADRTQRYHGLGFRLARSLSKST